MSEPSMRRTIICFAILGDKQQEEQNPIRCLVVQFNSGLASRMELLQQN